MCWVVVRLTFTEYVDMVVEEKSDAVIDASLTSRESDAVFCSFRRNKPEGA